jgi:hypothetical protein
MAEEPAERIRGLFLLASLSALEPLLTTRSAGTDAPGPMSTSPDCSSAIGPSLSVKLPTARFAVDDRQWSLLLL